MKKESIAIMQPYFFPYLGYYSLIKNTDAFIFFDTPQYIRRGWINRNRVLGTNAQAIFINVPVNKVARETKIKDITICNSTDWKTRIYGQLAVYKKRAPFYNDVIEMVKTVLESDKYGDSISLLAIQSIIESCKYLGIDTRMDILSEMHLKDIVVNESDEWTLQIAKQLCYKNYINPPGGKSFYSKDKYRENGLNLFFLEQELVPYNQKINRPFVAGLSIIDVLMFCSVQEVNQILGKYELV